ncbi:MAG: YARHG domain-containing protein [Firmicutes bacterium]|nr:YARHG domain-containing protein [Bacillota bacterium]
MEFERYGSRRDGNARFCESCGASLKDGARFCENCGAPVRSIPPKESVPEVPWYPEAAEDLGPKKTGTLKWILIGLGIGLGILLLIFGTMHFLKAADQEKEDSERAAAEQTTEASDYDDSDAAEYDTEYGTDDDSDDYGSYEEAQSGWDENNYTANYAVYATEEELYDPGTPVFFPDSSERYLSDEEVLGMNEHQLQKAVNDIYARNGKIFKTELFQYYYDSQTWYYGFTRDDDEIHAGMNDYEKKNVDLLKKHQ